MSEKTHTSDPLFMPMLMAFSGFALWTVCDAIIRYSKDYPVVLLTFLGDFFALFFLCVFARFLGGFKETFTRPRLKIRVFRGAVLCGSNLLSFVVFTHLDLATAYALIFITPILAKILSVLLIKEAIRPRSWAVTILGFAGVLIVLRPGMVPLNIGTLAALGTSIFFALGYVLSRYIGEENQTTLSLSIFQYFFATLLTAVPAYMAVQNVDIEPVLFLRLVVVGLFAILGSILVAYAFMRAPSAYVAPIHYTQILWGLVFGMTLFGEYPDSWTMAGAGVIIGAGLLLIRFSRRVPKQRVK